MTIAVLVRHGLTRPDVVVAGKQIAGVILTLDRREPVIDLRWINRGDILLGGRREEVCVGAVDVRCEFLPDRFQSRTSGLDDRLRARAGRHEHQLRVAVRVGGGVVGLGIPRRRHCERR